MDTKTTTETTVDDSWARWDEMQRLWKMLDFEKEWRSLGEGCYRHRKIDTGSS